MTGKKVRRTHSEKEITMLENEAVRDADEDPLKGDYSLIYPNRDSKR